MYKKYKRKRFNVDDKEQVDTFRDECFQAINKSKQSYFTNFGNKLTDKNTGRKAYWKIVKNFLADLGKKKRVQLKIFIQRGTLENDCLPKRRKFQNPMI